MSVPDSMAAGMLPERSGCEQAALIALPSSGSVSPARGAPDSGPPDSAPSDSGLCVRGPSDGGSQGARAERTVTIHWPDGRTSQELCGRDWLAAAQAAGQSIPTACLGGSCGACEIEVNGQMVRACVARVPASRRGVLRVELVSDPYW